MKENNGVLCPTLLIDSFSVVHLNGVNQSRMTSCLNRRAGLAFLGTRENNPPPPVSESHRPSEQSPMCPEPGRWEALLGR